MSWFKRRVVEVKDDEFDKAMEWLKSEPKRFWDAMDHAYNRGIIHGIEYMAKGMYINNPVGSAVGDEVFRVCGILCDGYKRNNPEGGWEDPK